MDRIKSVESFAFILMNRMWFMLIIIELWISLLYLVDRYNSYSRISRRDIERMGLERYRLKPDVIKIERFIDNLKKYRLY